MRWAAQTAGPAREGEEEEEDTRLFILGHIFLFFLSDVDYSELTHLDLKKELVFLLLKAMVAYDELGSLVPIKRTLQVIDYQNQANKESEVRCRVSTSTVVLLSVRYLLPSVTGTLSQGSFSFLIPDCE